MQYIQQAILIPLRDALGEDPLTRNFVGIRDQDPNREMAKRGAADGSLATLDLSEASDRVANWLVEDLFSDHPTFLEAIQACRSDRVRLPSGFVTYIQKFASMGSALTFPIEAMVFTAIVLERALSFRGLSPTRRNLHRFLQEVRVYGDDIIVPTDMAEYVIDGLEVFGLKVNRHKSFWKGSFRESCGKEYWRDYDVSIVKVRKAFPTSRADAAELVSFVETRNQLFEAGLQRTAEAMDLHVEPLLKGIYPVVSKESSLIGKVDPSRPLTVDGIDDDTQVPVTRGWTYVPKIPDNEIDGHGAMMKCLAKSDNQGPVSFGIPLVTTDAEHLVRSGRPRFAKLKIGMAPTFQ